MTRLREQQGATIEVDLAAQTVTDPNGGVHRFEDGRIGEAGLVC